MKGARFIVLGIFVLGLFLIQFNFISAETVYDQNAYVVNSSQVQIPDGENPDLKVMVLKYEPYPVIAGEWFDLWIKIQNVGQKSAKNLTIALEPEYPFSSDDVLTRNYGILYGTIEAYKVDQTYDASQVILKYRVKTSESVLSGVSNLKLKILSYPSSLSIEKNLPVEIFSSNKLPTESPTAPVDKITSLLYGVIGFIVGIFVVLFIRLLKSKRKSSKK